MKVQLGELKHLTPRTVWPNEARDFTPWLADNISALGEALGMELEVIDTESAIGDFSVDILARDLSSGKNIVIENQYGSTDHDHFGKLLTYASGVDASTLVWITEEIRDEHRQALEWLNEKTDADTFLFAIVLEILQIDQSAPAFNFKPIVFPNKWQKTASSRSRSVPSPRGEAYRKFFQLLVDELRESYKYTKAKVASPQSWYSFPSGVSGVTYAGCFSLGARARVEIYIDFQDAEENKRLFDFLHSKKQEIESQLGFALEWERLDEKRASRIAVYRPGSIDAPDEVLVEIRQWMAVQLLDFKKVFGPHITRPRKSRT